MKSFDSRFTILPLEEKYVDGTVEMHLTAFSGFFLAQLGRSFLREFYSQAAGHDLTVGYVAVDESDQVAGACFGVIDSSVFYKDILKRRWWAFGFKSLWAVIKSPKIIGRVLRAVKYRGDNPPVDINPLGSVLSVATRPDCQGSGCGRAVIQAVCDEYVRRGIHAVYLTTDADNNEGVCTFYESLGWKLLGHYTTPEGRKMCWYLWQDPATVS